MQCKDNYNNDCASSMRKRLPVNCEQTVEDWCQSACEHFLPTLTDEDSEDDEQEYLSDALKKRELDELKQLIGAE